MGFIKIECPECLVVWLRRELDDSLELSLWELCDKCKYKKEDE